MKKRIWLSSPTMCGKEIEYINEAFRTNWVAPLGPNVDAFEEELCDYTGAKYAVAMNTGTGAIHMALKYLGAQNGDVVFCSSLTFAASCNPIIYQNATPVFIDCEPESWNMSPVALEKAFKKYPNPKAVIVVHLYGQSADLDKILDICNKYNVPLIEDAAESLGATYKNKHTGTFGRFGIYSFNGNKIITTSGGGMLVCDDEEASSKIHNWICQSRDKGRHYQHSELGFNYRMSNISAGIGRGQLTVIEDRIQRKKEIYLTYKEAFKDIPDMELMPVCDYGEPNYWLTCATLNDKSKVKPLDIILALEKENIESRPIWKPMQMQPFYEKYDYFSHSGKSISEDIFTRGFCLPSDVKMTDEEINEVIKLVRGLFNV